jgi:hypothetical protein
MGRRLEHRSTHFISIPCVLLINKGKGGGGVKLSLVFIYVIKHYSRKTWLTGGTAPSILTLTLDGRE